MPGVYVPQAVKIEMGARADHWPAQNGIVTPYVAEEFPDGFKEPSCQVKVLSAERTFWEKATILHAEFNRPAAKPVPERFARHYYDTCELIQKKVADAAGQDLDLLGIVTKHKALFFKSSWAKHEEAAKGTLHLYPQVSRIAALRADYAKMDQMFIGEHPGFDEILNTIKAWEKRFNEG